MEPMPVQSDVYRIGNDTNSQTITLNKKYEDDSNVVFTNTSDEGFFVVVGTGTSAPTAVYANSATTPVQGVEIPAGFVLTYKINSQVTFFAAIQETAGTKGGLSIKIGEGV